MKTIRVHQADGLYLDARDVSARLKRTLTERYTIRFYEERICAGCEHLTERHSEEFCDPCPAYKAEVALTGDYTIDRRDYVKTPLGDKQRLFAYLRNQGYKVRLQNHIKPGKSYPLRFVGKLRSYQVGSDDALITAKRGVLKARARTGKTVMATSAVCKVGKKTLIVAAQREWLQGFYDTFVGSKLTTRMTNIPKSKINFCKTYADFESNVVCLATYQTFISPGGYKLLDKIRSMFDVIVIDEIHGAAAFHFLKVLSKFKAEYVWGLTATPGRKDNMYQLVDLVVGRVCHVAKRDDNLVPRWSLVPTGFSKQSGGMWVNLVKRLEGDPKRLKLIAEWAVRDAAAGNIILIPLSHLKPVKALVLAINKIAGEELAQALVGSLTKKVRKQLVEDTQLGKVKIVVGTIKLLSVGLNLPPANMLYEVALSSNIYNAEQRISRILTPHPGKGRPIVRVFLDDYKVRRSCLRNEWFGCIKRLFKPTFEPNGEQMWLQYLNGTNFDCREAGSKYKPRKQSPVQGW